MLLDELLARRLEIQLLCSRHGAKRVRVFGSVARREDRPDSDVDFLVDFPHGYDLLLQRLPLVDGLEGLLHRRVEVIPEHELSRHIRARVEQEAVEL
jgi:predicted nucleotidyltransferase